MHKQMSLSDLITHIIVEDTNNKECTITIDKTLYTKANMVQDKPTKKRYIHNKNKNKNNFSCAPSCNPTFKKKGNCFVCGDLGHYEPQCRNRLMRNDNPHKSRANLAKGDDIIVAVIS